MKQYNLTVRQVAESLNVSGATILRLASNRELASINLGRGKKALYRFCAEDLQDFLNRGGIKKTPTKSAGVVRPRYVS